MIISITIFCSTTWYDINTATTINCKLIEKRCGFKERGTLCLRLKHRALLHYNKMMIPLGKKYCNTCFFLPSLPVRQLPF